MSLQGTRGRSASFSYKYFGNISLTCRPLSAASFRLVARCVATFFSVSRLIIDFKPCVVGIQYNIGREHKERLEDRNLLSSFVISMKNQKVVPAKTHISIGLC